MQFQIVKEPMSIIEVDMNKGENITANAGAMVYMSGNMDVDTKIRDGGFFAKLKVSTLGGQSLFVNEFTSNSDGGKLGLTGQPLGDIIKISISQEQNFIVQSGSYIASTDGVVLDTQWQGFKKGLFGSELFMLKLSGQGDIFLNAFGGIIRREILIGEKFILNNFHLVALNLDADYKLTKFGSLKSTLLGGEGFVMEINGPAVVYFQTKNKPQLVEFLGLNQKDGNSR